jgi:hypothetical protein
MPESDANDSKQNAEPRQAVIYEGLSRTPRCRATKGMGGKVKP